MMLKTTRFLAALTFCAFTSFANAQTYTGLTWGLDRTSSPYKIGINLSGVWYNFGQITSGGVSLISGHVASNAELAATPTEYYPTGVWRDDYAAGFGAGPLWFTPLTGTCAANSLVNDGGSCVDAAGGNSWKAWWPAEAPVPALQFGVVVNDAASALTNCTAVNAALAAINTRSGSRGGQLRLPVGTTYTSCTIDNYYYGILVDGWARVSPHGIGAFTCATKVTATFAGTVLKHRTVYGSAATQVNVGGGFKDICVDGALIATRLLEVDSVKTGVYHAFLMNSVGTEAAYFTTGVQGTDFGESPSVQNADIDLYVYQLGAGAEGNAHGVVFTGGVNANISLNTNARVRGQVKNGNLLECVSGDNNKIEVIATVTGTGKAVYAHGNVAGTHNVGCGYNEFVISGPNTTSQGTDTPGVTSGVANTVRFLDTSNGSTEPVAGVGSSWRVLERNLNGTATGGAEIKLAVGDSGTTATAARAAITNESMRIRNASDNHIRLDTAGGFNWGINVDTTNGDLRIQRNTGRTVLFPASAAAGASFRAPHGTAPSSPGDGDIWTTTAAMFARINGATLQIGAAASPLSATKTVRDSAGTGTCTLEFTNGLLTGGTC